MINAVDKRMFYLMLSPTEGQEIANKMGFSTPSEDVQKMEIMDVIYRWATLYQSGVYDQIEEAAEWFTDFLVASDKINSSSEDFQAALTVFSISMLNKMMDDEQIIVKLEDTGLDDE